MFNNNYNNNNDNDSLPDNKEQNNHYDIAKILRNDHPRNFNN